MGASVNWDRLVVVGSLGFVVAMVLVGAFVVHDDDGPIPYATRPDQYSAGPIVDQAVGRAIEQYREVLDEGQNSPDCTWLNCPIASKYIPGVPEDRALFTDAERSELGRVSFGERARSGFSLYSVNRQVMAWWRSSPSWEHINVLICKMEVGVVAVRFCTECCSLPVRWMSMSMWSSKITSCP